MGKDDSVGEDGAGKRVATLAQFLVAARVSALGPIDPRSLGTATYTVEDEEANPCWSTQSTARGCTAMRGCQDRYIRSRKKVSILNQIRFDEIDHKVHSVIRRIRMRRCPHCAGSNVIGQVGWLGLQGDGWRTRPVFCGQNVDAGDFLLLPPCLRTRPVCTAVFRTTRLRSP